MTEEIKQDGPSEGVTSPDPPTHEATTPPGNGERDEAAIKKSEDELGKAGGGH
jgi:hypothetical protein